MVAKAAARLGLPHTTLAWTGSKPESGLMAAARHARYRLIDAHIARETAALRAGDWPGWDGRQLVTAHTLDDLAETFLMRLARGSGLAGLASLRPRQRLTVLPDDSGVLALCDLVVRRPLLGIAKARLIATLEAKGVRWTEDPSNRKDEFERVRVRKALPMLGEIGIVPAAIARSAGRLTAARDALEFHDLDTLLLLADLNGGLYAAVDFETLSIHPDETPIFILSALVEVLGGQPEPPDHDQVAALYAQLRAHTSEGKRMPPATIGGTLLDLSQTGRLRIWREWGRAGLPALELAPGDRRLWDGRFEVALSPDAPRPVVVAALGKAGWRELVGRVPTLQRLGLPPGAGATVPAFRARDGALLAVPTLRRLPVSLERYQEQVAAEWQRPPHPAAEVYRARFHGETRLD
jgi:tRNA(Ile)-lysidine synthase